LIQNTDALDSIIARSQCSKEFCNTIWNGADITKISTMKILSGRVAPARARDFGGWQGAGFGIAPRK